MRSGNAFVIEVGDLFAKDEVFPSVGPRSPAFSEFWLSAIGMPWLVVRPCPRRIGAMLVERMDGRVLAN